MVRLAKRLQILPVIRAAPTLRDNVIHVGRKRHDALRTAGPAERFLGQYRKAELRPACIISAARSRPALAPILRVRCSLVLSAVATWHEFAASLLETRAERALRNRWSPGNEKSSPGSEPVGRLEAAPRCLRACNIADRPTVRHPPLSTGSSLRPAPGLFSSGTSAQNEQLGSSRPVPSRYSDWPGLSPYQG